MGRILKKRRSTIQLEEKKLQPTYRPTNIHKKMYIQKFKELKM